MSFFLSFALFANNSIFEMEEETYIDDIPFNTNELSTACLYNMAMAEEFEMEEEGYIDDIPFSTECVTANCLYLKAMNVDFELPEEEYVDDIPFSTKRVVKTLISKN